MIYLEMEVPEEKKKGHTHGEDYAVCNGNPNQFKATPRKEYRESEVNYQTGLMGRQPL